jgi:hypothetical protein
MSLQVHCFEMYLSIVAVLPLSLPAGMVYRMTGMLSRRRITQCLRGRVLMTQVSKIPQGGQLLILSEKLLQG